MGLYDAGSTQKKLELILTEKWIASFGFSLDTYSDYRRTGFRSCLILIPMVILLLYLEGPIRYPYPISWMTCRSIQMQHLNVTLELTRYSGMSININLKRYEIRNEI